MKIDNIPNWVPLVGMVALGLVGWGELNAQVSALGEEQKAARMVIERSIANEARIGANASLLSGQAVQIQRAQQDVRDAVTRLDQTQSQLNTQQTEIIRLLNRLTQ